MNISGQCVGNSGLLTGQRPKRHRLTFHFLYFLKLASPLSFSSRSLSSYSRSALLRNIAVISCSNKLWYLQRAFPYESCFQNIILLDIFRIFHIRHDTRFLFLIFIKSIILGWVISNIGLWEQIVMINITVSFGTPDIYRDPWKN